MKFAIIFGALALTSGIAAQGYGRQDEMRNLARSLIAEYEDFLAERGGCTVKGKTCSTSACIALRLNCLVKAKATWSQVLTLETEFLTINLLGSHLSFPYFKKRPSSLHASETPDLI
ncbi:hypothetical protein BKA70DRAFT_1426885 [Coprinopsis sp. MPI-PUGE-AT-0042]|nr:hypothetical protein BKA70DRAFT_1426885 [Coprinopsis sp. MPI-PUGE-AT-0042]